MNTTDQSVSKFISSIEDAGRRSDSEQLLAIIQSITKLQPKMWGSSIIGFGSYHYKYATGREGDSPVIGFSPRKAALVLYGVIYYDQSTKLAEKLGPHTEGKGCLYIKDMSKINLDVLEQMIHVAFKEKPHAAQA